MTTKRNANAAPRGPNAPAKVSLADVLAGLEGGFVEEEGLLTKADIKRIEQGLVDQAHISKLEEFS